MLPTVVILDGSRQLVKHVLHWLADDGERVDFRLRERVRLDPSERLVQPVASSGLSGEVAHAAAANAGAGGVMVLEVADRDRRQLRADPQIILRPRSAAKRSYVGKSRWVNQASTA